MPPQLAEVVIEGDVDDTVGRIGGGAQAVQVTEVAAKWLQLLKQAVPRSAASRHC